MKAMIFAAGLGTRLKPLTDNMPKALVPIAGKPLLEHVILKLKASGFDDIIVNVHHFPEQIISFIRANQQFGIHVTISDERNQLLETGGGVKYAQSFFDDNQPFLVHNVDILSNVNLQNLYLNHLKNNPLATLVVSKRNTFRYFLFDNKNHLKGWINEKTGETKPGAIQQLSDYQKLAFSGIQILSPDVFKLMNFYPEKFSITDFYLQSAENNTILSFIPEEYKMIDVGKIDVIDEAENFLREQSF